MGEKSKKTEKRLAIISDVHADVHALRDALAQIADLDCDEVVCAGDLLDSGLFPEETIGLLRDKRIPCIRGNHDAWAVKEGQDSSGWDLTARSVWFLESLPESWAKTIAGVRVVVWHARPGSDMQGVHPDADPAELRVLLDAAGADVLVVGHTHVPMRLEVGGGLVVNPGAVLRDPAEPLEDGAGLEMGAPAPGRGTFGILDLPSRRFSVYSAADGAEVGVPPAAAGPAAHGPRPSAVGRGSDPVACDHRPPDAPALPAVFAERQLVRGFPQSPLAWRWSFGECSPETRGGAVSLSSLV